MSVDLLHRCRTSLMRLALVWVVVLTLLINGLSSELLSVLGPQHSHQAHHAAVDDDADWSIRGMIENVIGAGAMDIIDEVHARQYKGSLPVQSAHVAHIPSHRPSVADQQVHPHDGLQRYRHDAKDGRVIPPGPTDMVHPFPWRSHVSVPMERPPRC